MGSRTSTWRFWSAAPHNRPQRLRGAETGGVVRIEELLDQALELPVRQRAAFAERSCQGGAPQRDRLLRLLDIADQAGGFLERPVLRVSADGDPVGGVAAAADSASATPNRTIGAFRLMSRLGAGGMGEVWLADRATGDFRQRVA